MPPGPIALFWRFLDFDIDLPENEKIPLPLYHSCTEDEMLSFLFYEKIEAGEPCDIFEERLVYTFYGAAKFIKDDTRALASEGDATACIVIDSRSCGNVYRIYPVDTGVWSGKTPGHRGTLMGWKAFKEKFNLGDRIDRINKMVLLCFLDLEKYVEGKVSKQVVGEEVRVVGKYDPTDAVSQVKDMRKLMLDQSLADDRRFCCEVQFYEEMKLVPDNVLQVMAYAGVLEKERFKELTGKYRVTIDHSLFYPSSEASKYETGKLIKDLSIKFTKEAFIHGRNEI